MTKMNANRLRVLKEIKNFQKINEEAITFDHHFLIRGRIALTNPTKSQQRGRKVLKMAYNYPIFPIKKSPNLNDHYLAKINSSPKHYLPN